MAGCTQIRTVFFSLQIALSLNLDMRKREKNHSKEGSCPMNCFWTSKKLQHGRERTPRIVSHSTELMICWKERWQWIMTITAYRLHDVSHYMEIRDRVPQISTFLAHSVHVLLHATLFVVQCVDVALLLSWGVQVTLLSTGDQYCSTPTTGSGEQRGQRTVVWSRLQCTKWRLGGFLGRVLRSCEA